MVDILDRVIQKNKLQHVLEGLHKRSVKLGLIAPHISEYEFTVLKDHVVQIDCWTDTKRIEQNVIIVPKLLQKQLSFTKVAAELGIV